MEHAKTLRKTLDDNYTNVQFGDIPNITYANANGSLHNTST